MLCFYDTYKQFLLTAWFTLEHKLLKQNATAKSSQFVWIPTDKRHQLTEASAVLHCDVELLSVSGASKLMYVPLYEGRLKSSWTDGGAPLCCYAFLCITAAHCHQSTNFSNSALNLYTDVISAAPSDVPSLSTKLEHVTTQLHLVSISVPLHSWAVLPWKRSLLVCTFCIFT